MQVVELKQGSPEWHAHRASHFNASDAPAMLGCSPYKTRSELLREYATGVPQEVDEATQRRFDDGHRYEALARPLAEKIIGEDLYPVVGVLGEFSASFDGLTILQDITLEHKSLNAELRSVMVDGCTGADLPKVYRVQMEHQLLVSRADKSLFMASKWNGDELVEERHCWYVSDDALRAEIIAGWGQFKKDLETYQPEQSKPETIAAAIEALPALMVKVEGRVVSSNLKPFQDAALAFLGNIKTDLKTDQDFADAANIVKFCADGEARLELVKAQALSQTASIDELFRTIDVISAQMRDKRLALDKQVERRKTEIRTEIVTESQAALDAHVASLNARLGAAWIPRQLGGFAEAIKGKRTVDTVRDAANTALANAKIASSALADRLDANRKALVIDGADWFFLFADFATVGTKPAEDFQAIAAQRIKAHQEAEAKRKADDELRKLRAAVLAIKWPEPEKATEPVAQPAQAVAAVAEVEKLLDPGVEKPAAPVGVCRVADTALAARARRATEAAEPVLITTGALNERLEKLTVTADALKSLGFEPVPQKKPGVFWRESDFGPMVAALITHLHTVLPKVQ